MHRFGLAVALDQPTQPPLSCLDPSHSPPPHGCSGEGDSADGVCISGVDDAAAYRGTLAAMGTCGFTAQEQKHTLRLVAAILHLGDVTFVAEGDGSEVAVSLNLT